MTLIQPQMSDLTAGMIMRDVGTTTGSIKMARRVLNILGEVNAYSLIANTPERIEKLRKVAQLAASIEDIKASEREGKERKAEESAKLLRDQAAPGIKALHKHNTTDPKACGRSITVEQIRAVALVHMHAELKKENKAHVANAFNALVKKHQWSLPALPPSPALLAAGSAVETIETVETVMMPGAPAQGAPGIQEAHEVVEVCALHVAGNEQQAPQ